MCAYIKYASYRITKVKNIYIFIEIKNSKQEIIIKR